MPNKHDMPGNRKAPSGARPVRRGSRKSALVRVAAVALAVVALLMLLWSVGVFGGTSSAARDGGQEGANGSAATEWMSYSAFVDELDAGNVAEATLDDSGTVTFTLKDDDSGAVRATDNPGTDDFKERLLLAGVEVTDDRGQATGSDILDSVLNWFFYLVFFGAIGYGLWRWARYSHNTFRVVRHTGVTFDDVAGMDGLKAELGQVVDVLKHPQDFARRGVRPVKGIVLEGPPGNGKTLFARALAQEAGVNFIATKGADFQSAFMSLGARKIRTLFRKASRHKPCIVFIDEFDSIGERRSYAGTGIDKENNRIITAMLNEMDGFVANDGILVVAATNSYRSLDPALIRPGRFDLKFTVGNPDARTREQLIDLYVDGRGHRLADGLSRDDLVRAFDGLSCAAIETVINGAATLALSRTGGAAPSSGEGAQGNGSGARGSGGSNAAITMDLVREAARKSDVRLAR